MALRDPNSEALKQMTLMVSITIALILSKDDDSGNVRNNNRKQMNTNVQLKDAAGSIPDRII